MNLIALKMLIGDRAKYIGLVFGIAFATLLIIQQASIFNGILRRTASLIFQISQVDIWVTDKVVVNSDIVEPMRDSDLDIVRSVSGVKWAVPLIKTNAIAKTLEGNMNQVNLIGVDDDSLIGISQKLLLGNYSDIRNPDAFIVDAVGYKLLWPNQKFQLGKIIEMNDKKAILVAIVDAIPGFQSAPMIYTRYSKALEYINSGRKKMSFILVKSQDGIDHDKLIERINKTNLLARKSKDFAKSTIGYYLRNTGIPINFGVTVTLGLIVGATIVGMLLNMFINDNIKQFGALKAMGVDNMSLIKMVLTQSLIVLSLGVCIGSGMAATFFYLTSDVAALKGFYMPFWVWMLAVSLVSFVTIFSSIFSLVRILKIDPAIVFK